jgi:hypothetical protein
MSRRTIQNQKRITQKNILPVVKPVIEALTCEEIVAKLFPKGLKTEGVWNNLIITLRSRDMKVRKLEQLVEQKFHVRNRIRRAFPTLEDQLPLLLCADIRQLQQITHETWKFSRTHKGLCYSTIVLTGDTPEEVLMDFAVLSVIAILINYVTSQLKDFGPDHEGVAS